MPAGGRAKNIDHSSLTTASFILAAEERLAHYYRELANRLRPFDRGVSQLLEVLAQEREQQRRQVRRLAHAMFGTVRLRDQGGRRRLRHPPARHFFVLGWNDAVTLVQRAARLERRTSRLYGRCATRELYPQLRHLYWNLGECNERRAEVLAEAIEGFGLEADSTASAHEIPNGGILARSRGLEAVQTAAG